MHKAFVITSKGAEDICSSEIKDLSKATKIKKSKTVVTFEIKELSILHINDKFFTTSITLLGQSGR